MYLQHVDPSTLATKLFRLLRPALAIGYGVLFLIAFPAAASDKLADIFSSGLVLQRDHPVPLWGTGAAGDQVRLSFAGQTKSTTIDLHGRWRVQLDPLAASGEPRSLSVSFSGLDTRTYKINDVLVGEVWLCAGQSNMAIGLLDADNGQGIVSGANDPMLRMVRVPERPASRPQDRMHAEWVSFRPEYAASFSALAFFAGQRLRRELKVPVGLVVCAWGGSTVAAWISRKTLRREDLRPLMPADVLGWRVNTRPSTLFNGMLSPIVPFAVRGVLWYQGESDAEPNQNAYNYRTLFPAMIADWRSHWNDSALPFYWVQLPNLNVSDAWPVLRESQAVATSMPHTGMITTIDIGQVANLHPTNKKEFGERLAGLALARTYGLGHSDTSPSYDRTEREGEALRIRLHNADGLHTTDGTPPKAFELAGADGLYFPALATLDGESVILRSAKVTAPVSARYAWASAPVVNVINKTALPLSPFRTDSGPVDGEDFQPAELPQQGSLPEHFTASEILQAGNGAWRGTDVDPTGLTKADLIHDMGAGAVQLLIQDQPSSAFTTSSPALNWTTTDASSWSGTRAAARGVTVEVEVLMWQATAPQSGFDLEVSLYLPGGGRIYRLRVAPMQVRVLQRDEIRVLDDDYDTGTHFCRYRLAIRPDGVAEVYGDGLLLGLYRGETLPAGGRKYSTIRVGKTAEGGQFIAALRSVSWSTAGAFRPPHETQQ